MQFAGIRVKCEVELSTAYKNVEYFSVCVDTWLLILRRIGIATSNSLFVDAIYEDVLSASGFAHVHGIKWLEKLLF